MASDISTVKSGIAAESVISSAKGQAQGNGIDFAAIIRKSSSRLDSGLNALSDRAGISSVGERPEYSPPSDDYAYDRGDDRNDHPGNRADADDASHRGRDQDTAAPAGRADDYGNDRPRDHASDRSQASNAGQSDSRPNDNHGETAARDDRPANAGNDDAPGRDGAGRESVAATDGNGGEQGAVKGDQANASAAANKGANGQDGATAATAKQMLNSLLANAQENNLPGQAAAKAQAKTQSGTQKVNATEGLQVAQANVSKQAEGGESNAMSAAAAVRKSQTQGQSQAAAQGQTQSQSQAQNNALAGMQAANEVQTKEATKADEQASRLSRMVGNGNKIDVSVSVSDEKDTLVSKPSAGLVRNTVLAADSTTPSLRSQQSQGANNANATAQAQQAAAQAGGAAAQVQQAAQQATGTQAQAVNAAAVDAKAGVHGTMQSGANPTPLSGTGDTPVAAAPNSSSAAQQAQQNTSPQAANAPRFTLPNHAVADQVSVQINKALNAGNDRISIQLKPAELGRIDVQMEIGQDGRLIAVVTADNKNTLDLLQKDSKELQQALQQAGLQADDESLSFNLREQDDGSQMAGGSQGGGEEDAPDFGDELTLEEELAGMRRNIITDTRVDVSA